MPTHRTPLPAAEVDRRKSLIATHSFVGAPRADRLIANGHHPFHPSRIIVLEKDQAHDFVDDDLFLVCGQVRDAVGQQLEPDQHPPCCTEKLTLLIRVADIFARHYQRPDALWMWGRGLVWRETFASTGLGLGCGILHQFQGAPSELLTTDNTFVDWWVFLVPSGTDFDGFDDLPVHSLVGHLFESWHTNPTGQLKVWALASLIMREPPPFFPTFQEFSHTDPSEAARLLNDRLFCLLEEFEP